MDEQIVQRPWGRRSETGVEEWNYSKSEKEQQIIILWSLFSLFSKSVQQKETFMEGKPRVYESVVIPAPREQVWQKIRDFNALPAWHPGIAKSELEGGDCVGCVRHFFLRAGAELRERLLALSDLDCSCVYSMLESPMPIRNYVATLRLYGITATNETFAEWIAYFDVTDASAEADTVEAVRGVFKTGLESLVEIFG